jgi:hypothetical protein
VTASVNELERILADENAGHQVLWVRLDKKTLGKETGEKLKDWTQKGNVLWLDSDAAELFGFGNVRRIEPRERRARAEIARVQHPVVEGLQGIIIGYEVSADGGFISGSVNEITNNMIPLLVELDQQRRRVSMKVLSAIRFQDKGIVVFRPAEIDLSSSAARRFEEKLKEFCFDHLN